MDKWMQEARELEERYWKQDANDVITYEIFATALSSAFEAGRKEEREEWADRYRELNDDWLKVSHEARREEREAAAKVAEEIFSLAEHGSNYVRAAAWVAAAIRSREDKA